MGPSLDRIEPRGQDETAEDDARPRRATAGATDRCHGDVIQPGLTEVVSSWPDLPRSIREVILTLVRTADPKAPRTRRPTRGEE